MVVAFIVFMRPRTNSLMDVIGDKPSCKVLVAYEDVVAGQRAMGTFDLLAKRLKDECDLQHRLWKFEALRIPELQQAAAMDACDADVIIISGRANHGLPAEVKNWADSWSKKKVGQPRALVALVENEDSVKSDSPLQSFLKNLAQASKMDFFMRVYQETQSKPGAQKRPSTQSNRRDDSTTVLDSILDQQKIYGIGRR